ncbi:hypothetical protein ACTHO0_19300 [Cytobacillus praedii]|uniref:hypothetical protein n=1 Tax=Cytobacillus praedii TaxID=1742358 RepID=UPI003F7E32D1
MFKETWKVSMNPELHIKDINNGKLIIVLQSNQGYFLDINAYKIIEKTINCYKDLNDLYNSNYTMEQFSEFINQLISFGILLRE